MKKNQSNLKTNSIAEFINTELEQRGKTKQWLSNEWGASYSYVQKITRGELKHPSAVMIFKLAEVLDVDPNVFYEMLKK